MKILHVVPTYLPAVRYGGPIFAVHGLCRALAARGHEVDVFTTNIDGAGTSAVPVGVPVHLDDVRVSYFSSPFLRRLSWAPPLARALERQLARFDVLHLQSVFLWPTWAAARLARQAGVPYVVSPRGMLVPELIERRHKLLKSAWIGLIERSNLEHASAIHATSQLEADELGRFGWTLPRIAIAPNGVDEPDGAPDAAVSRDVAEIAAGQPLVLFFGRLSWKKGVDRLLRAFARTTTGCLAIVGPDDERLAPELSRLAAELRIGSRVRFLPRAVVASDKEHLFASARMFVLSSYSENFGNAVLEAMRRGVPVLVTPEVGAAEIVRAGGGGLVVPGEEEQLAAAIMRLLADPALARAMGAAGQRHVVEHFGWPRIAAQMEELYQSLAVRKETPCSTRSRRFS